MWAAAKEKSTFASAQIRGIFKNHGRGLLFVFLVHTFGSIALGTFGFFLPYILHTIGAQTQSASVGFNALYYGLTGLAAGLIFIPLVDRVSRRAFYGIAGFFAFLSIVLIIVFPLSNLFVVTGFIVINALASGGGQENYYRVWCQELFPTMSRATAQGMIIFAQKIMLAVWSVFVPIIVAASFAAFTWILAIAVALAVLIGFIWMPKKPQDLQEVA
jgi:inositol transporter-like SP family MFS transporter